MTRFCRFCHRPLIRKTYKNSIEREDRFQKRLYCSAGCAGEDKKKSPEIAFFEKIDKNSSSKFYKGTRCWLWTGAVNFAGYGKLRVEGKIVSAHRYSLELHLGRKLPPEQMACHHCFLPSTLTVTRRGLIPIESIVVGDYVLGSNGWTEVLQTHQRSYSGTIVGVTPKERLQTVWATEDHRFFLDGRFGKSTYDCKCKTCLTKGRNTIFIEDFRKIPALEISQFDSLQLTPLPFELFQAGTIKYPHKKFGVGKVFKPEFTPDFLRICGLYIAEGSVRPKSNPRETTFAFHREETEYINEVKTYFKKHGFSVRTEIRDGNGVCVIVASRHVAHILSELFGSGCETKIIPWDWLNKEITPLIEAVFDGDGAQLKTGRVLTTTSPTLAWQIHTYLREQQKTTGRNSHVYNVKYTRPGRKKVYRITWGDKPYKPELFSRLHSRVEQIEVTQYSGLVYDLTVADNSHNYTVGCILVSNCDNPPCCNPDHLFVGSAKDNAIDMVQKRRDSYARQPWRTQFHNYLKNRKIN